jgi:hypothetical protein
LAPVETEIDWNTLSDQLSIADQDKHRSTISLLDRNEPKYFWITKNVDFTQWESDENSQALWLSGPSHRGMKEVSSHIIGVTKEKAIQSNSSVLYFSCSAETATRGSIVTTFAHTLLHQIVRSLSDGKARSIAATFFKTLLRGDFRRSSVRFEQSDSRDTTVKKILNLPDDMLHDDLVGKALVEAIRGAGIRVSSLIIEGVEGAVFVQNVYFLVKHMMDADPKFKALVTSPQSTDLQKMQGTLPCIEYDKERQGLHALRSQVSSVANWLIQSALVSFNVLFRGTRHAMTKLSRSIRAPWSGSGRIHNIRDGRHQRAPASSTSKGSQVAGRAHL